MMTAGVKTSARDGRLAGGLPGLANPAGRFHILIMPQIQ